MITNAEQDESPQLEGPSPIASPRTRAKKLSDYIPSVFLSSSSRLLLSSASPSGDGDSTSKLTESSNSSSSSDCEGCDDWEEDFFLSSPTTLRKGLMLSSGDFSKNVGKQLQLDALSCLLDDDGQSDGDDKICEEQSSWLSFAAMIVVVWTTQNRSPKTIHSAEVDIPLDIKINYYFHHSILIRDFPIFRCLCSRNIFKQTHHTYQLHTFHFCKLYLRLHFVFCHSATTAFDVAVAFMVHRFRHFPD